MKLRRLQLYKVVWQIPFTVLAREAGVSDTAIAKACRRHDIPTPGRGYWRKVEMGHSPAILPVSAPDRDEETSVAVRDSFFETLESASTVPKLARSTNIAVTEGDQNDATPPIHKRKRASSERPSPPSSSNNPLKSHSEVNEPLSDDPSLNPAAVLELAHEHARIDEANRLLDALQDALSTRTAGVRALGFLWCSRARDALGKVDPVARLLNALEQAAARRAK